MQGPWTQQAAPEAPKPTPVKLKFSFSYWYNMYMNGVYLVVLAALVPWMLTLAWWFSVPLGAWFIATGANALSNFVIALLFAVSSKFRNYITRVLRD